MVTMVTVTKKLESTMMIKEYRANLIRCKGSQPFDGENCIEA